MVSKKLAELKKINLMKKLYWKKLTEKSNGVKFFTTKYYILKKINSLKN